jgi:HlyD family secretion protein
MMSKKKIALYLLLAAAAVAALVWAFTPGPVVVELAAVTRGRFEQTVDEDGKTRVRERYVVSAPLAGRLQRITLKAGDAVERGAVIASMLPAAPPFIDARTERELQERVGAAEATLARARTQVEHARAALAQNRADAQRTQKLAVQGFVSPTQLERDNLKVTLSAREAEAADFERDAAVHQLDLARAALMRSRQVAQGGRNQQLEIRAPVAGSVLRVTQESEAVVALGAPLLEIGDPAELEAVIDVLSSDALHIAPGQTVRLERHGNNTQNSAPSGTLEGRVRRVEPSAFTKVSALGVEEQRVNVVIDITSPREQWKNLGDAYRVDARIVVFGADNALSVPVAALFRDGKDWAVFVADNGVARKRVIETSRRGAQHAMEDKGLTEGERVVVYPGDAVRDGRRIGARGMK